MTTKTTAFSTGARMGAALTLFALFALPSGAAAQTNGVTAPIGQLPRSPVAPYVAPPPGGWIPPMQPYGYGSYGGRGPYANNYGNPYGNPYGGGYMLPPPSVVQNTARVPGAVVSFEPPAASMHTASAEDDTATPAPLPAPMPVPLPATEGRALPPGAQRPRILLNQAASAAPAGAASIQVTLPKGLALTPASRKRLENEARMRYATRPAPDNTPGSWQTGRMNHDGSFARTSFFSR